MSNFYVPKSAMAIYAHPDDIEFSCSGTLARWAQNGAKISFVLVTSGDVGIADPDISREEAIKIREGESKNAADIIGASEIIFIQEKDGMVQPSMELRKKLVREIRRFKPEVVLCGDPTSVLPSDNYINHPDHRATATAAIDAVFPASGQPNLFEDIENSEGFLAHKPRKVYINTWSNNNTFVNIEETFDLKIKALMAHKSQMVGWDPEPRVKDWSADMAKGKEMKYAEAFRVITLESDEDWKISEGDPIKLAEHRKKSANSKQKENISE